MGPDDLPEDVDLVFKGIDGAEAESFIQAVQRTARTEGRSRDNEWIIDLVSTCMTGEALRWYVELDEETQNDWKLLRKAILRQYPPLSQPSTSALVPIIPTPAAAATPPTPTSATHSTQTPARIYRIRVYFTDTPSRFFLSTKDEKHVCLTNNVARAFTVRWTSKKELKLIESGAETQRMIGLIWYFASKDRHKPGSTSDFALFFLSDSLGNVPPITKHSGAMKMTRWTISNDGWLESKSDVGSSQLTNQFYTSSSGGEGSFTRACLPPGLAHWNIERDQIFKMKLEPI